MKYPGTAPVNTTTETSESFSMAHSAACSSPTATKLIALIGGRLRVSTAIRPLRSTVQWFMLWWGSCY